MLLTANKNEVEKAKLLDFLEVGFSYILYDANKGKSLSPFSLFSDGNLWRHQASFHMENSS